MTFDPSVPVPAPVADSADLADVNPSFMVDDATLEAPGRRRKLAALLHHRGAMLAAAFLLLVVICALFGHWLEPYPPNEINVLHRNLTPSWTHWFGTDDLGRDILSRIIAGAVHRAARQPRIGGGGVRARDSRSGCSPRTSAARPTP